MWLNLWSTSEYKQTKWLEMSCMRHQREVWRFTGRWSLIWKTCSNAFRKWTITPYNASKVLEQRKYYYSQDKAAIQCNNFIWEGEGWWIGDGWSPRKTWELRKELICGLQLGPQYHHAWPSLRQTDTALCAHLHLSVDHQLPDRQASASEAGKTHIQNSHHQHWRPPGLRSLPIALLPLHQWLHFKGPLCQAPEFVATLQSSASSRMETSMLTDRRLSSCLSGAVLTTWS